MKLNHDDTRERILGSLGFGAALALMASIAVLAAVSKPDGWAVWFVAGPLCALLATAMYGVWFW